MAAIRYNETDGEIRIITIDGKVSCECCTCSFGDSASGGDEPYFNIFELNRLGIETTLEIFFEAYEIKDEIIVTANGVTFSSGCISNSVTHTMYLPNGAETISVSINPNCEGETGTIWDFSITCVDNAPP